MARDTTLSLVDTSMLGNGCCTSTVQGLTSDPKTGHINSCIPPREPPQHTATRLSGKPASSVRTKWANGGVAKEKTEGSTEPSWMVHSAPAYTFPVGAFGCFLGRKMCPQ